MQFKKTRSIKALFLYPTLVGISASIVFAGCSSLKSANNMFGNQPENGSNLKTTEKQNINSTIDTTKGGDENINNTIGTSNGGDDKYEIMKKHNEERERENLNKYLKIMTKLVREDGEENNIKNMKIFEYESWKKNQEKNQKKNLGNIKKEALINCIQTLKPNVENTMERLMKNDGSNPQTTEEQNIDRTKISYKYDKYEPMMIEPMGFYKYETMMPGQMRTNDSNPKTWESTFDINKWIDLTRDNNALPTDFEDSADIKTTRGSTPETSGKTCNICTMGEYLGNRITHNFDCKYSTYNPESKFYIEKNSPRKNILE